MFKLDTPLHPWHPDEDLYPRTLIRSARRVRIAGYATLGLSILVFFFILPTNPGIAGLLNPLTVVVLIPLLSTVATGAGLRWRLSRSVRRAAARRCLGCGRILGPIAQTKTCGHCGRTDSPAIIDWAWRRAAGECVPPDPPREPPGRPSTADGASPPAAAHPCRFGMTRTFLPRACLRRVYPWAFPLLGAALILDLIAMVADWTLDLDRLIGRPWQLVEVAVYLGLYLGFVLVIAVLSRSMKRHVRRQRGCLCLECGQDLDPEISRGQCPECGSPYDLAATASIWAAFDRTTNPFYVGQKTSGEPPRPW